LAVGGASAITRAGACTSTIRTTLVRETRPPGEAGADTGQRRHARTPSAAPAAIAATATTG
jgi:hypothetical protein